MELKIKQKNAEINFIPPVLPAIINADKRHLTNAIENVIENAFEIQQMKIAKLI